MITIRYFKGKQKITQQESSNIKGVAEYMSLITSKDQSISGVALFDNNYQDITTKVNNFIEKL